MYGHCADYGYATHEELRARASPVAPSPTVEADQRHHRLPNLRFAVSQLRPRRLEALMSRGTFFRHSRRESLSPGRDGFLTYEGSADRIPSCCRPEHEAR